MQKRNGFVNKIKCNAGSAMTVLFMLISPVLCQWICELNCYDKFSIIEFKYLIFGSVLPVLLEIFIYYISQRHMYGIFVLYITYWLGGGD